MAAAAAAAPEINHRLRFLRSDGDGGVFVFSNATLSDDFAILPLERRFLTRVLFLSPQGAKSPNLRIK